MSIPVRRGYTTHPQHLSERNHDHCRALGSFYLGKEYDLAGAKLSDVPVMYDARDLTTHAVCVGMTGSGKTGLCIDLMEEAAIDQVPTIIIDPKGDITNLLLTFPDLLPEDFQPWINADDARRKDMTPEAYAANQAETWAKGLADWDQGPERIKLLKESGDFVIYTPGSDSGVPVSILSSFAAPQLNWDDEQEALRERISGTVSALLGLIGVEADPVRSREHILLATIFEHYWRSGQNLDLAKLIMAIQNPPGAPTGRVRRGHLLPAEGALRPGHGAEQHHRRTLLRHLDPGRCRWTSTTCSTAATPSPTSASSTSPT